MVACVKTQELSRIHVRKHVPGRSRPPGTSFCLCRLTISWMIEAIVGVCAIEVCPRTKGKDSHWSNAGSMEWLNVSRMCTSASLFVLVSRVLHLCVRAGTRRRRTPRGRGRWRRGNRRRWRSRLCSRCSPRPSSR